MFTWFRTLFGGTKKSQYAWKDMLSGDRVRIHLKDPKKFGIFDEFKLTFQRLDEEDVRTKKVMAQVSQNLNKKPYSKNPPMMGIEPKKKA